MADNEAIVEAAKPFADAYRRYKDGQFRCCEIGEQYWQALVDAFDKPVDISQPLSTED